MPNDDCPKTKAACAIKFGCYALAVKLVSIDMCRGYGGMSIVQHDLLARRDKHFREIDAIGPFAKSIE